MKKVHEVELTYVKSYKFQSTCNSDKGFARKIPTIFLMELQALTWPTRSKVSKFLVHPSSRSGTGGGGGGSGIVVVVVVVGSLSIFLQVDCPHGCSQLRTTSPNLFRQFGTAGDFDDDLRI